MRIIDLSNENGNFVRQSARLLVEEFTTAWATMEDAREEVAEMLHPTKIVRIAVENNVVLGWVGANNESYDKTVWELHPLVVDSTHQRQGIGRALVADLEIEIKKQGGESIFLGTDDEDGSTSLANKNLYPNVWAHVANIQNLDRHPYEFYQKQGYVIVGIIPDANGLGKPDIIMAKRLLT